jgi:hypothetical protein
MDASECKSLVTVATYSHPVEAWIARNRLADDGISAFVQDDHLATMDWLYTNAIGGVKVQVPDNWIAAAVEALAARPDAEDDEPARTANPSEGKTCSKCGSAYVYAEAFSKRHVYLCWLVLGVPLPILGDDWRCFSCGHIDRRSSWLDKTLPRQFSLRSLFVLTLIVACILGMFRAIGVTSMSITGSAKTGDDLGY